MLRNLILLYFDDNFGDIVYLYTSFKSNAPYTRRYFAPARREDASSRAWQSTYSLPLCFQRAEGNTGNNSVLETI